VKGLFGKFLGGFSKKECSLDEDVLRPPTVSRGRRALAKWGGAEF